MDTNLLISILTAVGFGSILTAILQNFLERKQEIKAYFTGDAMPPKIQE